MSNQIQTVDQLASLFAKSLPILPVLGFVFALCYEISFFHFLDFEMRQVLRLSDLFEITAITIIPLFPFLIIGMWLRTVETPSEATVVTDDSHKENSDPLAGPVKTVKYTLYFSAVAYIFTGIHWTGGPTAILMIVSLIILKYVIQPTIVDKTSTSVYYVVSVIWIFATGAVLWGHLHAYFLRYGPPSNPVQILKIEGLNEHVEDLGLVRRLSSGIMVMNSQKNIIWFVPDNQNFILSKKIDPKPYEGLICDWFDWCWQEKLAKNQSERNEQ